MWSVWLVFCDCDFHSVCPLMDKDKRLMEASCWEILTEEETGSCSDGWGHAQKFLLQFPVDGHSCAPSLVFDLSRNNGGDNEDKVYMLQTVLCRHCHAQCHQPCSRLLLNRTSTGDSWTLTGKSGSVYCGSVLLSPGSWCTQGFVCVLQMSGSQSCGKSVIKFHCPPKSNSLGVLSPFAR